MKKIINRLSIIIACFILVSCGKDFLNTKPQGLMLEAGVRELGAESPASLIKIVDPSIKGIYTYMYSYNTSFRAAAAARHDDFGQKAIDLSTDMMTEDIVQYAHHWFGFDYLLDNRLAAYARTFTNWNFYYKIIRDANVIIAQIDSAVTDNALKAVRGQALALRAYSFLNLAQLYQQTYKGNESAKGVPLYITPAVSGNPRGTLQDTYNQVVADLNNAIVYLNGFVRSSKEEINKNVAQGILARAYLNMERWSDAATAAQAARSGLTLMSATQYNQGFNDINNTEWMWGGDINANTSTVFASFFSHMDNLSSGYNGALGIYKLIDKKLYDLIPATDARKQAYKAPGSTANPALPAYSSYKFRDPGGWVGDYVYMRAAEMYLIEAEALARAGSSPQAAAVLQQLVVTRDPSYSASALTGQALIDETVKQRRIELWGEGFSLNDYKRWKKGIDRTGSNHRADALFVFPAGDIRFVYQLPQREMETNSTLLIDDQNP